MLEFTRFARLNVAVKLIFQGFTKFPWELTKVAQRSEMDLSL